MVFEPKKYWTTYWNGLPCPTRSCHSAPRIIDFSRIVKENITFMAQVYPYRGLLLFIALQKVLQLQIMMGMISERLICQREKKWQKDRSSDLQKSTNMMKRRIIVRKGNYVKELATLCLVGRKVETRWLTSQQLRWRENETMFARTRHLVFGEKEGGRGPWLQSPLARGRAAWAASWELSFNFNSSPLSIPLSQRRCFTKDLIERMTRVVKDDYQDDADGVCLDVCAHRGREKVQPTNEPPIQYRIR